MKRELISMLGVFAVTIASGFAQTPPTPATPQQPVGTISGFAPNPISGFQSGPVGGFSSTPVGGFTPNSIRGLASTNTFAPADVNPLTTTVGGFQTGVQVLPQNPNVIVSPVVPPPPVVSNRFSTPLF
jgi:hypothetical protein